MWVFGVILVCIFPTFSHIRTENGEILRISLYSVWMWENAGKLRIRITPNMHSSYAILDVWQSSECTFEICPFCFCCLGSVCDSDMFYRLLPKILLNARVSKSWIIVELYTEIPPLFSLFSKMLEACFF